MANNMNFVNRISDTQKQLTRCKDMLKIIWHQEIEGVSQPRIKLQLAMVQSILDDVEEMISDGIQE